MKYENVVDEQIKKLALDKDTLHRLSPLLESVNDIYKKNLVYKSELNRLEEITSNLNILIYKLDKDGNIVYLNSSWEKLSMYSLKDSIGKHHSYYLRDLDNKPILDILPKDKTSRTSTNKTIQILNKIGEPAWLEVNINNVFSEDGVFEGHVGSIVDNTEIKNTELQLICANKTKSEFLSTMSHEIRTPLNAVIGIAHLLLIEDPKPEQLENISTLKYSSEHLLALINDILDYNKIISGSLKLEQASFSLSEILNTTERIFKNKAATKNIHFQIYRDKLIQDVLIGDKTRLTQIITNLVGNAIKFTDKGSVTLEVNLVSQTQNETNLNFVIKDTGIGILQDKIGKIFKSFAQASSNTTRLYGGSGLGLAICEKLLSLMKSEIKVESIYGLGSKFSFPIVLKKGNPVAPTLIDNGFKKKSHLANLIGVKILVVEDNKINILVIEKFLKKWKLDYDFAQNGQLAVEAAFKKEYDIILMDIQMPVMNGFDASLAIRASDNKHNKNVPIYALTASTGENLMQDVLQHGMDGLH